MVRDNAIPANETEAQGTITRDTTPPALTVNWPEQTIGAESYQLTGSKEANSAILLNGEPIENLYAAEEFTIEVPLAEEGANEVTIVVRDNAVPANETEAQDTIIRDTAPTITEVVDDGESTNDRTQLHAAWSAQEHGIQIAEYYYAIGTAEGEDGTDVVDWTSAGLDTEVTVNELVLTVGQPYYFNVKARNAANIWSRVVSSDGIIVLNRAPEIISLTPENNARFIEEEIIRIEVLEVHDEDEDSLRYRYLVDDEPIQGWTDSSSYSWQTERGDLRLKTITVEVRDECEATDSAEIRVFLFRKMPSPEDE